MTYTLGWSSKDGLKGWLANSKKLCQWVTSWSRCHKLQFETTSDMIFSVKLSTKSLLICLRQWLFFSSYCACSLLDFLHKTGDKEKEIKWNLKCFLLRNAIIDWARVFPSFRKTHFQSFTLVFDMPARKVSVSRLDILDPSVNMTLHKHIIEVVNATKINKK